MSKQLKCTLVSQTSLSCQLTHQFGLLCIYRIAELQQRLELIIFSEGDYLHHCSEFGEDLKGKICTSNASVFETQCFSPLPWMDG